MSREYTNKLYDLMEEGILSHKSVILEMILFFSEDQIKDFCLDGFGGLYSEEYKHLEEEEE